MFMVDAGATLTQNISKNELIQKFYSKKKVINLNFKSKA